MKTYSVSLVACDNISAFHLAVPCLVFQDAFIGLEPVFKLNVCSENSMAVELSSGFSVPICHDLSNIDDADIVVVPSWPNTLPEPSDQLLEKLRKAYQRNAAIVGLCLGSYVVAKAGLLDGKKATTHWQFNKPFQDEFPNVTVDCGHLFIEQDRIITSAGTAASLDCCLHLVRKLCGNEIATQIARTMVIAPFRSGGQQQYIPLPIPNQANLESNFRHVLDDVLQNLSERHDLDTIATRCAMSRRTFTRQFKSAYGCTFGEWLLNHRLVFTQHLLESTDYSIATIAELSGIGAESHFRKYFKKCFNVSPSEWRRTFKGNLE